MLTYRSYSADELEGLGTYAIIAQVWGFQGTNPEPEIYQKNRDGKWYESTTYEPDDCWVVLPEEALYAIVYNPMVAVG